MAKTERELTALEVNAYADSIDEFTSQDDIYAGLTNLAQEIRDGQYTPPAPAPVTTYAGGFAHDLEALEHCFTLVGMARFNRKQAFGGGPFSGAKLGNAREYAQAAQDILSTFIARNS